MSAQAPPVNDPVLHVPRRWNETLEGIAWLPRLIDKARMARGGTLGAYLFGHSPVDIALLARIGTTTEEFAAIVAAASSDADVLAALRGRGFDEARARRWSARLPHSARFFTYIWDVDDGYVTPGYAGRAFLFVWRGIEYPLMRLMRRIFKAP